MRLEEKAVHDAHDGRNRSRRHKSPEQDGPVQGERERSVQEADWLKENTDAIQSYNRWVEEHGIPLSNYRQF